MYRRNLKVGLVTFMSLIALMIGGLMYNSKLTVADVYLNSTDESGSIKPSVQVGIVYSDTEVTRGPVEATVVTDAQDLVITNNEGNNSFVFEKNGTFTFQYLVSSTGEVGEIVATVTWIDDVAPTAQVVYDKNFWTNGNVVATLVPSEDVTVLNNSYQVIDDYGNTIEGDPFLFIFNENGEFVFEYVDEAGNRGSTIARVDWIDKVAPMATVSYSSTQKTTLPVNVEITFDEENVTILNNDGKNIYTFNENGEFTFKYRDIAGNEGEASVLVDWIIKKNPTNKKISKKPVNNDASALDEVVIYKELKTENVELEVSAKDINSDLVLKKNTLNMSSELTEKYGNECDFFELQFVDLNGQVGEVNTTKKMTLRILLNATKAFENVYEVSLDGSLKEIDYKMVNGNKLEFKTSDLSKYLIVYKDVVVNNTEYDEDSNEKINNEINVAVIICSCIIGLVILMSIICVFIKG